MGGCPIAIKPSNPERFMSEALKEAQAAFDEGEVPIGCVIVKDGSIVGRGHNQKERLLDPTAHAEMLALREAAAALGSWRLDGATLFVTAEPCLMCIGAAAQARIGRIVFGCVEPKFGAVSLLGYNDEVQIGNHRMRCEGGVLESRCAQLLRSFFAGRRGRR